MMHFIPRAHTWMFMYSICLTSLQFCLAIVLTSCSFHSFHNLDAVHEIKSSYHNLETFIIEMIAIVDSSYKN